MKSVLFTFDTTLGTFWIRPEPAGRVRLGLDKLKLHEYGSANAAAKAVRDHQTGYSAWDEYAEAIGPSSLEKWKRGEGFGRPKARAKANDLRSEASVEGDFE
ncbi:MAG: hypothetical protein ACJ746_21090 [Bryobacteraceae bacterium]